MPGYSPSLPLSMGSPDDTYQYIDEIIDLVKQNVKTILLTSPGERIWMPNFGVGLRRYLFEFPTDSLKEAITDRIKSQFELYMPFLDINAVIVAPARSATQEESEILNIKIEYLIKPLSVFEILQLEYNALEKSVMVAETLMENRN